MLELKVSTKKPNLGELKKVCDLIHYDGPLVSLFISGDKYYLYVWVDSDETHNRWLIYDVIPDHLKEYINGRLNLLDLCIFAPYIYVVDLDNNIDGEIKKVLTIPHDYMPYEDSFYNSNMCSDLEKLKAIIDNL